MVQDPSEIIEWFNAKSLRSNILMQRIKAVSEWYIENIMC
jgi:hypothetical protein